MYPKFIYKRMKKTLNNKMPLPRIAFSTASKPILLVPTIVSFLVILSRGSVVEADSITTSIGAIINANTRIGKEQKTAMNIAVQNFNNKSMNRKLSLHFHSPGGDPLQAAFAAKKLIEEKQVQVIIGMETWTEAALVSNMGNQFQVPVISFADGAIKTRQWPFLVQMVTNVSEPIDCTAAIVHSFNWRRVIVVYEKDMYGGDSRMLALLSEALQNVGSDIEYHLVIPTFSSLSDPEEFVREELKKLHSTQARAFIVLRLLLPLTNILFSEAKKMGFMGKDSAWVITDTIASFLDSANRSFISSMEGVLGMKTYYSENSKSFLEFYRQFQPSFELEYPEEENSKPGIHAVRAYDSITTITGALERLNLNTPTSKSLLDGILSSNFSGLSGEVHFEDGRLSYKPIYQLINVFNMTYKKLGYWSPAFGFSRGPDFEETGKNDSNGNDFEKLLDDLMKWPGNLKWVPKGWAMPTWEDPLIVGVPGKAPFENFVKVTSTKNSDEKTYTGFCIRVFEEVKRSLEYDLPFTFVEFNGGYNDLVNNVANKTFGAAVGDVTILAKRWSGVEYTQPFTESGLAMVVPVKPAPKAWIFLEPFTLEMWLATGAILIYTMFIVWFLEHRSNPEFSGCWKDQLGNVLWFTFSSLFLAHREKIQSNYSRVVVVVWLFVALVLTQSYTASLTSMLTISRLQPNFESLKITNAKVGCSKNSFMRAYVQEVLGYKSENVMPISHRDEYLNAFENGSISAAFLGIPYAKVFVNNYCRKYTTIGSTYRFGGFGFVFQKGSPIADDVSKAILKLSEDGTLKRLEEEWLTSSSECSNSQTTENIDSLSFQSFWGLYLFSIATSSICFLLFVGHLLKNYWHHQGSQGGDVHASDESVWKRTIRLVRYLSNAETGSPRRSPSSGEVAPETEMGNTLDYVI